MMSFRLFALQIATLMAVLTARAEVASPVAVSNAPNPLVWDALEKKMQLPGMTNLAYFTFWVTNTSTADATIAAVEAECDCTVIEARKSLPWTLAPGASGPLNARVNIRGRFGPFVKTISVFTDHGPQMLTLNMNIPLTPAPANVSVRHLDVLAAKADRQAVFRGNCAVCHVTPAMGLSGGALFEKACAICHMAEPRAEMVSDLTVLKGTTDAAYWRAWITSGKSGTVMPAFAHSEGGILDTNQIESLIEYALKAFPSQTAAKSKQPLPITNQTGTQPATSPENANGTSPPPSK